MDYLDGKQPLWTYQLSDFIEKVSVGSGGERSFESFISHLSGFYQPLAMSKILGLERLGRPNILEYDIVRMSLNEQGFS